MTETTAFVTGGTGFLGLNLVEQLTEAGWRVTVLHRPKSELRTLERFPVSLAEGDILDPESLRRAVPRGVDAVFHLAADISVWSGHDARQTRVNVEGTRNVVEAALAAGARRLVHTSTWNTYGLEQGALSEELPQTGGGSWINYNRTKFRAEEAVRAGVARGLEAVIVNPCHIMGRYDRRGWARLIIDAHRHWLPGAPPGAGMFCHGEQVARAHIAAALRGRSGENYLLPGAPASFVEVFRTIGEVAGCRVPKRALPGWTFRLAARAGAAFGAVTGREPMVTPEGVAMVLEKVRVVSDRAERELGFEVVPLRTLVEDSYAWLKAEGFL